MDSEPEEQDESPDAGTAARRRACKLAAGFAACVAQNATFSAQVMVIAAAISHALRLTLQ